MTETNEAPVETVEVKEIDWKEFSRKLLFEGIIPASEYAVSFTVNEIDDTTVEIAKKLGEFLLQAKK